MYNSLGTTRRSRLHLYVITLILIDNTFVLVNLIINNDDNAFWCNIYVCCTGSLFHPPQCKILLEWYPSQFWFFEVSIFLLFGLYEYLENVLDKKEFIVVLHKIKEVFIA